MTQIDIDIRTRIIKAADELFEAAGREQMPTVDTVRRTAKVDMNSASRVMKEWRSAQTAQALPVAVAVPDSVSKAFSVALGEAWHQAQELASESLLAAQQGWETERKEFETMRFELATAYEQQATELADVLEAAALAEQHATAYVIEAEQQALMADAELKAVRDELLSSKARREQALIKAQEVEHRVADLQTELERTRTQLVEANTATGDSVKSRDNVTKELEKLRISFSKIESKLEQAEAKNVSDKTAHDELCGRLNTELAKANEQREVARQEAADTREAAAELKGELKAVEQQSAALLARITPPVDI